MFCRILVSCEGADWPLSRKFGCAPEMAVGLLHQARALGLDPYGVSFHVGSQQTDLGAMGPRGRRRGAHVHAAGRDRHQFAHGQYRRRLPGALPRRGRRDRALRPGRDRRADPRISATACRRSSSSPGRSLVGDAGVIQSEVVLIADKGDGGGKRWVYLDVGKFNGLAETMDESIKYRIEAPGRSGPPRPVILAGPTCDSADILYEHTEYRLPRGSRGRRQGRDPVGRRLHRELRLGRVQRLPAAAHLLHLSRGTGEPGAMPVRAPTAGSGGGCRRPSGCRGSRDYDPARCPGAASAAICRLCNGLSGAAQAIRGPDQESGNHQDRRMTQRKNYPEPQRERRAKKERRPPLADAAARGFSAHHACE